MLLVLAGFAFVYMSDERDGRAAIKALDRSATCVVWLFLCHLAQQKLPAALDIYLLHLRSPVAGLSLATSGAH